MSFMAITTSLMEEFAYKESLLSDDPSTGVGASLLGDGYRVFVGRNNIPGTKKTDPIWKEREAKYAEVVHAEADVLLKAGFYARGGILFVTHPPCCRCAGLICASGVKRVVLLDTIFSKSQEDQHRFLKSLNWKASASLFQKCDIELILSLSLLQMLNYTVNSSTEG